MSNRDPTLSEITQQISDTTDQFADHLVNTPVSILFYEAVALALILFSAALVWGAISWVRGKLGQLMLMDRLHRLFETAGFGLGKAVRRFINGRKA